NKWQREYRAFLRLLPELLKTHKGKYVAIHEEQCVDTDEDKIALALRVYARYGYVPIQVGLVAEEQPVVRIPHRRPLSMEGETRRGKRLTFPILSAFGVLILLTPGFGICKD